MPLIKQVIMSLVLLLYYLIWYAYDCIKPKLFRRSKSIRGELVLITGAGNEFGMLLSKKFARLGADIVLVDTDISAIQTIAREVRKDGVSVTSIACDMSKDDIYRLADKVIPIHFPLDYFRKQ